MDITALIFYAIVCALLSMASPRLGTPVKRLAIGAAVGIVAAALLPILRDALAI
ncbi:MAG: hypothetical protein AAF376_10505 [Pseudomonadota bacterium]